MNNSASGGGVGFLGLLTIVFIALKLTHVISWSWFWVVSPLWLGIIVTIAVLAFFALVLLFASLLDRRK